MQSKGKKERKITYGRFQPIGGLKKLTQKKPGIYRLAVKTQEWTHKAIVGLKTCIVTRARAQEKRERTQVLEKKKGPKEEQKGGETAQ